MGLKHYEYVWKHYKRSGSHKLVLMALAEHANENDECWPSMQTLADMACVSLRQVVNIINDLRDSGHIETIATRGRSQSNVYKLTLKCEVGCTLSSEDNDENNMKSSAENVKPSTNNVKPSTKKYEMGFTRSVIEPNTNTLSANADEQAQQNSQNKKSQNLSTSSGKKEKPRKPAKTSKQNDAEPPTQEHQEWFAAMCWLVYGHKDYSLLAETDKIAIGKTSKELRKSNYTIDDLRNWYRDIWSNEFPGKQKDSNGKYFVARPMLKQIKTGIGRIKATETQNTNGFVPANNGKPSYLQLEQL